MIKVYTYPSSEGERRLSRIVKRGITTDPAVEQNVREILTAVKEEGDEAVLRYARRFDAPGMTLDEIRVRDNEIERAYREADDDFLGILHRAIDHIESFHRQQLKPSWFETRPDGTLLGQMNRPVSSAGLYIPGGKGGETPLISSVLMNGLPARIAGVEDIALVTPPRRDGSINPFLLVAAREVGVSCIYKLGSAWAVAALAYGTATIKPVDVIVGPGNVYVTIAKKIVSGEVGIDLLAGPSEILVIADEGADVRYVAADLLSQAEHDTMASAILVTPSEELANALPAVIENQLKQLSRRDIARESLEQFGAVFVTEDLERAVRLANHIAPEHLELVVDDPWRLLGKITNAGAVFMGPNTPEAVGDYFAGPNHVLPTAGTARFASALGVEHFMKKTSVVAYSREALQRDGKAIIRLAELEGLQAHAASVRIRLNNGNNI